MRKRFPVLLILLLSALTAARADRIVGAGGRRLAADGRRLSPVSGLPARRGAVICPGFEYAPGNREGARNLNPERRVHFGSV